MPPNTSPLQFALHSRARGRQNSTAQQIEGVLKPCSPPQDCHRRLGLPARSGTLHAMLMQQGCEQKHQGPLGERPALHHAGPAAAPRHRHREPCMARCGAARQLEQGVGSQRRPSCVQARTTGCVVLSQAGTGGTDVQVGRVARLLNGSSRNDAHRTTAAMAVRRLRLCITRKTATPTCSTHVPAAWCGHRRLLAKRHRAVCFRTPDHAPDSAAPMHVCNASTPHANPAMSPQPRCVAAQVRHPCRLLPDPPAVAASHGPPPAGRPLVVGNHILVHHLRMQSTSYRTDCAVWRHPGCPSPARLTSFATFVPRVMAAR